MRGSAVVDARTNTLIVRETVKRLEEAKKLIRKLDIPVRQVMIEVRIVSASNNFAKQLGVRFGGGNLTSIGGGKSFGIGGRNTLSTFPIDNTTIDPKTGERTGTISPGGFLIPETKSNSSSTAATLANNLVDLGTSAHPYGALGMTLARGADYVLNLELQALQDQGQGELLSNPRVLTSDRCLALIKQGEEIPYVSVGLQGTMTIFKDAVLSLEVLPQITPSGSIVMALRVTKDARGALTQGGFGINKQELQTNVHVMDGETVVLGGAFLETIDNQVNKVPFFADLPGIGFLFKRTTKVDDKTELLIFVTPKIVKDNVTVN